MTETLDNTLKTEDQTEDLTETRPDLTWRDIERLQTEKTGDPDHLFSADPETQKTWISGLSDPEDITLYLDYGSKISRYIDQSDRRLSDIRKIQSQRPIYQKRSISEIESDYYRRYPDRRPKKIIMTPDQFMARLETRLSDLLTRLSDPRYPDIPDQTLDKDRRK